MSKNLLPEWGVVIGRFQPFHNGHLSLLLRAFDCARKLVIVIGSATSARTIKNPWSADERQRMIVNALNDVDQSLISRVSFVHASDYFYNDNMWIVAVQQKVAQVTNDSDDVVLIGHTKDSSSFYLKLFPQWRFTNLPRNVDIDATAIREMYFRCDLHDIVRHVPPSVYVKLKDDMMDGVTPRDSFMLLKEEFQCVQDYREEYKLKKDGGHLLYPVIHHTVDAVVIQSGHVLVVRRRCTPGKGLVALPGGFLNENEFIFDGSLRELKEETRIRVPLETLRTSVVTERTFDHPHRSLMGRRITTAYCFSLGNGQLPRVQGEDDADKSWWMSLREFAVSEPRFFEDHWHIIDHFVRKF